MAPYFRFSPRFFIPACKEFGIIVAASEKATLSRNLGYIRELYNLGWNPPILGSTVTADEQRAIQRSLSNIGLPEHGRFNVRISQAKVWSCTLAFSTILLLITSRNLLITGECNAACGGGGGECPRRHRACFCSGGHRRRLGRRVRGTFRPQGIWPPSKLCHQHFACRQHVAISTLPSTRCHQHFACHAHFAINTFGPQHPHTHRSLRCCGPSPASRCCMPSPLPSAVTTRRPFMMAVLMAAGPGMSSATLTQRTATTMRGQMAAWCVGATLRPGGGSCVTSDALVACALCHASPPSPHPSPQGAAADGGSGAPSAPKKARGSKTKLTSDEIAARKAENELRHSVAPQVSAMLSHRATPPPIPPHATPRCAFNHSAAYVCLSGHLTDVAAMDLLLPGN